MADTHKQHVEVSDTIALTAQFTKWLRNAGVERSELAMDVADILAAAKHIARLVEQTLRLDPREPAEADEALSHLAEMRAWLFTEMKPHLTALEETWPALEDRLDLLAPTDEE